MIKAKQAQHNQFVLTIVLFVFLIGVAINHYAPSAAKLQLDIDRLNNEIRIERARSNSQDSTVCPTNVECQSALTDLKRRNWVMENGALRERIFKLEKYLDSKQCKQPVDSSIHCARINDQLTEIHRQEQSQLEKKLKYLHRLAEDTQAHYYDYIAATNNTDHEWETLLGKIRQALRNKHQ